MRTSPQRASYVAIKSAVASNTIFFTSLAQAKQDRLNKSHDKVTNYATWFDTSALNITKKHIEVKVVVATQKLSESGLRGLHSLNREMTQ